MSAVHGSGVLFVEQDTIAVGTSDGLKHLKWLCVVIGTTEWSTTYGLYVRNHTGNVSKFVAREMSDRLARQY
jgi:hypothetical protein